MLQGVQERRRARADVTLHCLAVMKVQYDAVGMQ